MENIFTIILTILLLSFILIFFIKMYIKNIDLERKLNKYKEHFRENTELNSNKSDLSYVSTIPENSTIINLKNSKRILIVLDNRTYYLNTLKFLEDYGIRKN